MKGMRRAGRGTRRGVPAGAAARSAHGHDPAKGIRVALRLQPRQRIVQLQRHRAGLARLPKLAPLALVGERAHGGHHHGGAGGEDLVGGCKGWRVGDAGRG